MNALYALAWGAGIGAGGYWTIMALAGHRILPRLPQVVPNARTAEIGVAWAAAAILAALVVYIALGWIVAAAGAAVVVWRVPNQRTRRAGREQFIARTEAIASWAEMIRDNMAGSAGLEQALLASAAVAPDAIRPELHRFAARLDRMPLADALVRLGEDLAHPSGDLVVVSLVNAVRMEARELGPLLGRLAEAIRGDVKMRLRVEVGRARIRTSARIVIATTAITIGFLLVFSRRLLEVYDSAAGQLWLLLVAAVFAAGGWLLRVYGAVDMPERFTARTTQRTPR